MHGALCAMDSSNMNENLSTDNVCEIPDLYHYTGPPGCIGIISGLQFWATQVQYMNDEKEVRHAADLAREIMSQKYRKRGTPALYDQMGHALDSMHGANTFIVSFSENEDQLSQWRAYCRNGGVCLGFSGSGLVETIGFNAGFKLRKCIYEEEAKIGLVEEIVEYCFSAYENSPSKDENSMNHFISNEFYPRLLLLATTLKNETFKEEAEWRLVGGPFSYKDPRFGWRPGSDMIIPYLKYSLGDDPPIVSACSGPSRQAIDAGRSMSSFLHAQPWWKADMVRLSRTKTSFRSA